jgi:hypothetical protein
VVVATLLEVAGVVVRVEGLMVLELMVVEEVGQQQ